jgi:hypothetical protein
MCPSLVARGRCAQHLRDVRGLHDAHRTRISARNIVCVTMRQIHASYIRESDTNVARTCRTRSAQQGMLPMDPSLYAQYIYLMSYVGLIIEIILDSNLCERLNEIKHKPTLNSNAVEYNPT